MEKTNSRKYHCHAVLVAGLDNVVVTDGAAGFGNVLHAASLGALDVVTEGEERVAAESYAAHGGEPCLLFLLGEGFGLLGEEEFPCAVAENIVVIVADVDVDGVVAVGAADVRLEGEIQNLLVLSEVPVVRLVAGESGAVDSRLLTRAHADCLTVLNVADGIGLGVFQSNEGDDEVVLCRFGEVFVLGDDVAHHFVVNDKLVSALLEGHAVNLLALDLGGLVILVHFDDAIGSLALGFEDF